MMNKVVIITARFDSSRFPGKILETVINKKKLAIMCLAN